ncbi:M16 family metallopeptidase [Candidatus Margulisiibacteriota bacterium]
MSAIPIEAGCDNSLALERIIIVFPGGAGQVKPEKQGLTSIFTDMLKEGPSTMTPLEFRKKLFLLNAGISFSNSPRAIRLTISTPPENLKKVLKLTRQILDNPLLKENVFTNSKKKILNNRIIMNNFMDDVIEYTALRDYYAYHPDILDGTGSVKSIQNVVLSDVIKFWQKNINYKYARVYALGPINAPKISKNIKKILLNGKKLGKSEKYQYKKYSTVDYPLPKQKILLIDKPGATDHQIFIICPMSIKVDSEEYLTGLVANHLLGGGLEGKLGQELREKRGLTYHIESYIKTKGVTGWIISTFGGDKQVPELLKGIPEIVKKFKNQDLGEAEIQDAISAYVTIYKKVTETPMDRLSRKIRHQIYGLDEEFFADFIEKIQKVKKEDIENFIKNKITLKNSRIYLMGDKKVLLPVLNDLGYKNRKIKIRKIN